MADDDFSIDGYQLINCIATGNYTQVWEGAPKGSANRVAVKLMLKEAFGDAEHKGIFKNEAKIAKALDHPNIVRCQEAVFTKKHAYMVMDFFPAPNLKAQLGSNLSELQSRMRKMAEEICLAVGYMHDQGWLHRDLKPDNVLVNRSSEMRLIDFSLTTRYARGIAKAIVSSKHKVVQGTRTYIAPETVMKQPLSPQTDIYSLGIMFFEVLTGVPPFVGSSPGDLLAKHVRTVPPLASEFNPNVATEMSQMVARMLKKRPKERHQNIQELLSEIRNIKIFNTDPKELQEQKEKETKERQLKSLDEARRLDSRADALRSELRGKDPNTAKIAPKESKATPKPAAENSPGKAEKPAAAATAKPQTAPAPAQAPQQPAYQQPMYPPQAYPQYYPQPGYPQPYPMQPQYYPGYPPQYAPGMPPGYPPQAPAYPQGYPPPGQMPGAPMAPQHPGYPNPGVAQQQPPVQQSPPAPQAPAVAPPRAPAAAPARPPANADLPVMDQLPPIRSEQKAKAKPDLPLMEELPPIKKETKKDQLPLMEDLPPVV